MFDHNILEIAFIIIGLCIIIVLAIIVLVLNNYYYWQRCHSINNLTSCSTDPIDPIAIFFADPQKKLK